MRKWLFCKELHFLAKGASSSCKSAERYNRLEFETLAKYDATYRGQAALADAPINTWRQRVAYLLHEVHVIFRVSYFIFFFWNKPGMACYKKKKKK